ncbi:class I SAM-dependent methyltransferase [Novosphingobium colocasiae]|uniref:S-adenosyl-L-methionine (SAM)-dependent methyltransferase PhcB n=1 Tax=Novosphingobium colocasiae TaxID=1256513 RepID=A0A918PF13_9SPHN|nr:class I SAM-dependent methyltransferase [Novosphingobium colocasiae]GGZ04524.1 S-adenosyl-L-methionine (SAM)-dependent methyltransferase PhcB [Novosphingobium colocasiae]
MTTPSPHPSQHSLADSRFGSVGARYVTSAVHASGADLDRIAARAAAARPVRALDLGAGGGHVAYAMAPHAGSVVACDLSAAMLEQVEVEAARRSLGNIETTGAAAEALPFADGAFDMLACRFSTHHWRDAPGGLREARRVLQRGAPATFVDVVAPGPAPADSHLQAVELLRDTSHVRDYSAAQWLTMLEMTGFAVEAMVPSRLRMDFADWTDRMRTSTVNRAAIRALQTDAPREVADHFAIEPDGSFTIDVLLIEAR